jgi:hypothetical protein
MLMVLLIAFLADGVELPREHMRKLQERSDCAGLMPQTCVVATAVGSPVRA